MERDKAEVERRAVPGFPGYEAGSDGSLWSSKQQKDGVFVQRFPTLTKRGYVVTRLSTETGRIVFKYLHHIVLEAFVGPCPQGCQACHNDGNKQNNALENLRWDTPKANASDRVTHGTSPVGEKNPRAILNESDVIAIRAKYAAGSTRKALATEYHVAYWTIEHIVKRLTWKHLP